MILRVALMVGGWLLSAGSFAATQVQVAVDGPGCLRFVQDGRLVYAKKATLTVTDGRLAHVSGPKVVPAITLSPATAVLSVSLDGSVVADGHTVGRLVLAVFATDPSRDAALASSPERPSLANPGEGEAGVVRTGASEAVKPLSKAASKTEPTFKPATLEPTKTQPKPAGRTAVVSTDGRVRVVLNPLTEIESAQFTIGQIANVAAAQDLVVKIGDLALGDTPPLGVERIVDKNRLLMRLKAAGIDLNKVDLGGPDKARVVRKGQTVSQQPFVEAAVKGAQAKGLGAGFEASTPGPAMTVPLGTVELVAEAVSGVQDTVVTVGVYVDGKRFNSRSVHLRSTSAAANLKPGAVVTVRVVSRGIAVESKGKVVRTDQSGQVTVQIVDTGAQLTGVARPDGSVEVKA